MGGLAVGQAQSRPGDQRGQQENEERARAESEQRRRLEAAYEARQARAHARLGSLAGSVEPNALCPALVGATDIRRTYSKRVPLPFKPRSAAQPRWRSVSPVSDSPSGIFARSISEAVVQSKCINCHVKGGVSGHTRLVLLPSSVEDHEAKNLAIFEKLVASVEGAADLILNKIQGVGHGGGIQVPAGSADFANMERFLRLLGGETTSGTLSPETLFDGVTMASPAKTLRRAAMIFAGRLPTGAELASVNSSQESSLRRSIRSLMAGPGFHEFLIRASNDRLLTDRHLLDATVIEPQAEYFFDLNKKFWEIIDAASGTQFEDMWDIRAYRQFQMQLEYAVSRSPLELIAYVVENDLPYTEILTADYIMANPVAAEGYGTKVQFENNDDPTEFKPSKIASYYRNDDSKVTEYDRVFGHRVINPGNLSTDYPHAGILNTTVFLRRYPTTDTNRNRARSRWTYYHFLGLDIEKSASRTTDPDALADTDNPTLKNPACTVCHSVLDPVAGAFQNYGDGGFYRDQWGGFDSLAQLYKEPDDGTVSPYQQDDTWYRDMRSPGFGSEVAPDADNALQWLAKRIAADERFAEAAVKFWWPAIMGVDVAAPPEDELDRDFEAMLVASTAQAAEIGRLADAFRNGIAAGRPYDARDLLAEITLSPWFRAESVTGKHSVRDAALRHAGVERMLTPEELERKTEAVSGYVWGRRLRRMSDFGVGQERTKLKDFEDWGYSYGLLYGGIDSDGITKRSGDMTPLMAAVAQSHAAEVSCPIVLREFYFWPDERRLLFDGISRFDTPVSDLAAEFEVVGDSWETRQEFSESGSMTAGAKTVRVAFTNDQYESPDNDRNLHLDRLVVRGRSGQVVAEIEFETLKERDGCTPRERTYWMYNACTLDVVVEIPADGVYEVAVTAYQDRGGDENARLSVAVQSDESNSRGSAAIRNKLVDLHEKLYGVTVAVDSPDIEAAYSLFTEVWQRKRDTEGSSFWDAQFECAIGDDHLYYEGLLVDFLTYNGGHSDVNWELAERFRDGYEFEDPHHSVRAWVVTLAYLLTDYRYLHY